MKVNRRRTAVLAWLVICVMVFGTAGCAAKKGKIRKPRPVKLALTGKVRMDPPIEISLPKRIERVCIGEFKNLSSYTAANVVFTNALKFKLQERGFTVVTPLQENDLKVEGVITKCEFSRAKLGLGRGLLAEIRSGKSGRIYNIELDAEFKLSAYGKDWQTKITSQLQTKEREVASAANAVSLKIARRLIRAIKR